MNDNSKPSEGDRFKKALDASSYEHVLSWDKPMTSKQAAKYLMTHHFVPVEFLRSRLSELDKAHAADRAADRERIAELEQELADQKEVYGCTVGELKEEIERYASMYVSLKGIDACQQKRIAALEAEIAKLKQPSEELKSLFDSSLPTMHTNKKGQQVWTPDECKQVTRITELMKAVAARESAMKAEIERLKAENEMFRKVGDYLSSPLNCVLDTIKRKIRYHQLSEKRERALKDEIAQLKADKAMLLDASNHVLDEIWDSCDCFTEAQQALHNLIAKHTEAKQ